MWWGVTETKEHDSGLRKSFVGNKDSFPLVTILDTNVVISLTNIKLGKVVSILQLVHKVGDEGKRVCVSGGMFI